MTDEQLRALAKQAADEGGFVSHGNTGTWAEERGIGHTDPRYAGEEGHARQRRALMERAASALARQFRRENPDADYEDFDRYLQSREELEQAGDDPNQASY